MRHCEKILISILILFLLSGLSHANRHPQVEMVKRVMPAVVGIGIEKNNYISYRFSGSDFMEEFRKFYQREEREFKEKGKPQWDREKERIAPEDIRGIGSGFIIDPQGKVVTNYHVIEGQRRIFVMTHDGKVFKARVIREAPEDDLALLEIEASLRQFPFLKLGDSDAVEVAEPVIAIGNPFGLSFTVTSGIVSAVGRTTPDGKEGLIQTDAAVNPGNSGGPLLNLQGEVIGINTMIYASKGGGFMGVAFAIPVNKAKTLLASDKEGRSRAYLGVRVSTTEQGLVKIESIEAGSPAFKAGLKEGEIILSVNNKEMRSANDLVKYIQNKKPGDKIVLKIKRKGAVEQVTVTLEERRD
ncbi:MAG: trypsin-like peptidase domain-containing protein [Desulfobacterota bacterium]|nr:trypsin-like peptidase domain-containing protein [Thermodesulfobacteriota bacterium]